MTSAARTRALARSWLARQPGDGGAAAVLLLLLTPALFGLAGLVLDGGTHLAARQHAADLAEQAARAGADQLDTSTLRATGTDTVTSGAARSAACRYVQTVAPDATCTATVDATPAGPQVQVRVRTTSRTALLGLIGINTLRADAVGSAQAVTGIRTTALPTLQHRRHRETS
jgi:Flp pilus assembly protein TadG